MPLLHTTSPTKKGPISIYYKLHAVPLLEEGTPAFLDDPRPKVLLLMGFAASHQGWAPQVADLLVAPTHSSSSGSSSANGGSPARCAAARQQPQQGRVGEQQQQQQGPAEAVDGWQAEQACGGGTAGDQQLEPSPCVVCVLDNRGVGRSTAPTERRDYSTRAMAADALQVLDHLGWGRVHVIGHSMGAMVACKLAAAAPQRLASLSVLSATGGGWQAVPKSWSALWLGIKLIFARDPESRARCDVRFHFSASLLAERDPLSGETREEQLVREYVAAARNAAELPQAPHGMRGQLAAVMGHRVRGREVRAIQSGAFPILVIHGRDDAIALPRFGRRLARRLGAPCLELPGGHFVMREQAAAVNALLRSFIMGRSFLNVERYPFFPFEHWVSAVAEVRAKARRLPLEPLPAPTQQQQGRPLQQQAQQRRQAGNASTGRSSVQVAAAAAAAPA